MVGWNDVDSIFFKGIAAFGIYLCGSVALNAESVLDVLILYTSDVEDHYNGEDGVLAHVHASVASANQAFENSEIEIRLRMRSVQKIDYVESSEDMADDLNFITESNVVANLRDEVGADLVCLYRDYSADNVVGVAWLLNEADGKPNRAFSVTSAQAAMSSLVFQHEIGHNLGGAHDRENSESGGINPYSHGYRFFGDSGVEYRTIMAYAPGQRINYYSNPEIKFNEAYLGITSGEDAADNARTFNETGLIVDSYRAHLHLDPIANAKGDRRIEDLDRNGVETVRLDGSRSVGENIVSWNWTWAGGSLSGPIVDVELPIGSTEFTLSIEDEEGYVDDDTIVVTIVEYSPIVSVEAGFRTGFYLKESGDFYAFGYNDYRQLGLAGIDGVDDITPRTNLIETPTKGAFDSVESISNGQPGGNTLFKMFDGSVWGAGYNSVGQLGDGTSTWRETPVKVYDGGVHDVALGFSHSLFLMENGSVWGAGSNGSGQLGLGGLAQTSTPVQIVGSGVESISAGRDHSVWVNSDGSMWSVGIGLEGQLGDGLTATRKVPIEVISSGVKKVSAGSMHTLILMEDGSALWTGTLSGGRYDRTSQAQFSLNVSVATVVSLEENVVDISAGFGCCLFLTEGGSLWVMGENWFDQDGDGRSGWAPLPTRVIVSGVIDMDAGENHCLVLRDDGSVWSIGRNDTAQLGIKASDSEKVAIQIADPYLERTNEGPQADAGPDVNTVSRTGGKGGRVILDGSLSVDDWQVVSWRWSWDGNTIEGRKVEGTFDVGTTRVVLETIDNDGLSSTDELFISVEAQAKVIAVSTEGNHTLVLKDDGSLWASGYHESGQLGIGGFDSEILNERWETNEFRLVERSGVVAVETFAVGSFFIKEDGSLWGMGSNYDGLMGVKAEIENFHPVELIPEGVKGVYSGGAHSLVLMTDGSLWGMGRSPNGELGIETQDIVRSPTLIVDSGVVAVSAAESNSLFVKSDGSVWGMGRNEYGNLGVGTNSRVDGPTKILPSGVSDVSQTEHYSLFLKHDGTVLASGRHQNLSLDSMFPVQLDIAEAQIAMAGGAGIFIVKNDGSLFVLGSNIGWLRSGFDEFSEVFPSRVIDISTTHWRTFIVLNDGSLWGAGRGSRGELGNEIFGTIDDLTELIAFDFESWLRGYFKESEISGWSENASRADPDTDGLSNKWELVLGTDPARVSEPGLRLVWYDGRLMLEANDYKYGLTYKLWGSKNMADWEPVERPTLVREGKLLFEPLEDNSWLYRLEVSGN